MDRAHVHRLFSAFPFLVGILVLSSIFVAGMKTHGLPVSREIAIAEGFAIAGVVWSIVGVPRAKFGIYVTFPAEAFMTGGYIFIAIVYKAGIGHCAGYADTPFGEVSGADGLPSVRDSCGKQTAIFALSAIVAILFGCSILCDLVVRTIVIVGGSFENIKHSKTAEEKVEKLQREIRGLRQDLEETSITT